MVQLSTDEETIGVWAIVDSGASRSFFPKSMAALLGLNPDHLVEDEQGATGVEGGSFPTWSSTKQLEGQIIRINPQTRKASEWGAKFPMDPAFAEKDAALLGRNDFFQAFTITFAVSEQSPLFTVES